jgi:hypothetical protein
VANCVALTVEYMTCGAARSHRLYRQIERTLKLKMERLQSDTRPAEPSRRMIQNTLASRTLTALPGEVFV